MEAQGVATAYLSRPVTVAYLTGFRIEPHERLMALVLSPNEAVLVVPALEEAAARQAASGVQVKAWADGQDPWLVVGEALGGAGSRLGVEKDHLSLAAWERLRFLTGAVEAVDVGPHIRRLRARKTPEEVERLQRAARITDRVAELVLNHLSAGRTEQEVAVSIELALAELGAEPAFDSLVQSGPNSALPHLRPTGRRLQPGDLVLLDFGGALEGYRADLTRMAVLGEPDPRQREMHRLVLEAHDAALAVVRAGATTGEVDAAARSVIGAAGLGDRFLHRVGHGLGLEAHEEPSLEPGGTTVLEEGMVVTVEPGVYIPSWGGIRIEDDVVVEAGGARLLTQAARELRAL